MKSAVVIPNWNGKESLRSCLASIVKLPDCLIVVVDNGSVDGSVELIEQDFPEVRLIKHSLNLGFAAGVNSGIKYAMAHDCAYIGLLNNDAMVDKDWLAALRSALEAEPRAGIATSKILSSDKKHIDSTGEQYSVWGLPFARGRGQNSDGYNSSEMVFGASGGASLYRAKIFEQIGLFDANFFAYYEDVDVSFRAQLSGWLVLYEPKAKAYHQIGATSSKVKGFTTYQTVKNLPFLIIKDVPLGLLPKILPRFLLAYFLIIGKGLARGQVLPVLKGLLACLVLMPKKFYERWHIQRAKQVSNSYIESLLFPGLPPGANGLRGLRAVFGRTK